MTDPAIKTAKPGPRAKKAPVVTAQAPVTKIKAPKVPVKPAVAVVKPRVAVKPVAARNAPVARAKAASVKPVATKVADTVADVTAKIEDTAVLAATDIAQAAEVLEAVTSPAVESDSIVAEAEAPAALTEGTESMATIDTSAADKAQAVFGDMQTRFKTAWDKSSKIGEELVDFAKGNVEAVVASAKVAAKHGEELSQEAVDYGKTSVESTMAMFRSLASAKSPTELFQLQSDFAKSSFDGAVAQASKVSEKMLKIAGDVAQPISSRYAVAAEKIKTTTF